MRDYSGDFRPDLQLEDLAHDTLARYARDVMLANHIHDRSGLAPVAIAFGQEAQTQVACDEWMSASPIYNMRNRLFQNIEGNDVGVALKGFQLDIGAPHNYLNFHYEYVSPTEGYFWTSTCGPFNYVHSISQGDEAMQTQLCHHMEDPTFDATVIAVNPQMRCKAVYRPPLKTLSEASEKGPCRWHVTIVEDIALAEDCPFLDFTSKTLAATFKFPDTERAGEGLEDYSGPLKRDFCLEDLTHNTLATQCKEFLLHVFLLNYSCYYSISKNFGEEHALPMAQAQYHHLAPVTVHRLRNTFKIEGDDVAAIMKVLQLNPFLPRDYFDVGFSMPTSDTGFLWLNDCAGYQEPLKLGIASLMMNDPENPGFVRLAEVVNDKATVELIDAAQLPPTVAAAGAKIAWKITVDSEKAPAKKSDFAGLVGEQMWDIDNSKHHYKYDFYDALENFS